MFGLLDGGLFILCSLIVIFVVVVLPILVIADFSRKRKPGTQYPGETQDWQVK